MKCIVGTQEPAQQGGAMWCNSMGEKHPDFVFVSTITGAIIGPMIAVAVLIVFAILSGLSSFWLGSTVYLCGALLCGGVFGPAVTNLRTGGTESFMLGIYCFADFLILVFAVDIFGGKGGWMLFGALVLGGIGGLVGGIKRSS